MSCVACAAALIALLFRLIALLPDDLPALQKPQYDVLFLTT